MVVQRACQTEAEWGDCPKLKRHREIAGTVVQRDSAITQLSKAWKASKEKSK